MGKTHRSEVVARYKSQVFTYTIDAIAEEAETSRSWREDPGATPNLQMRKHLQDLARLGFCE